MEDSRIIVGDNVDGAVGLACRSAKKHAAVAGRNVHRVVEADGSEKALVGGRHQSLLECFRFIGATNTG